MEFVLEKLVWAILPGLIVGIVLAVWNRRQKRRDDAEASRADDQMEAAMLQTDLTVATAQLSYAVAMAVKRGTPNGEMETAIEQYNKAMTKFRKYSQKQVARGVIGND